MKSLLFALGFFAIFPVSIGAELKEPEGLVMDRWNYLPVRAVDLREILPPPPAPGSIAAQADTDTLLQLQSTRTPAQVRHAEAIASDTLFNFSDVLGRWFARENLPLTAKFINSAFSDAYEIFLEANATHKRARPSRTDDRIKPALAVPETNSYPSAHAWEEWFWAGLLSEIYPEYRAALMERARAAAWSRVVAGLHYPTDVTASRVVANATLAEMLKLPAVRSGIRASRAESEPVMRRK